MAIEGATYDTGTATVAAGGTAVTGQGTGWKTTGLLPGDQFWAAGLSVTIAAVNSDTSLTLATAWPGAARNAAAYEVRYVNDGTRATAALETLRQIVMLLNNGNLDAIADLVTAADTLPYYTGAGQAALTTFNAFGRALLNLGGGDGKVIRGIGTGTAEMADIVGTVSHASGVPRGALFEAGINSAGRYVFFADGTALQWGSVTLAYNTATRMQAVYTFPATISGSNLAGAFLIDANEAVTFTEARRASPAIACSSVNATCRLYAAPGDSFAAGQTAAASVFIAGKWF